MPSYTVFCSCDGACATNTHGTCAERRLAEQVWHRAVKRGKKTE